jgi:hypothetical protein
MSPEFYFSPRRRRVSKLKLKAECSKLKGKSIFIAQFLAFQLSALSLER